jgi:hypothetical protein
MRRILLCLPVLLAAMAPMSLHASVLFTDPPMVQVKPETTFQVDLAIDTQGEDVNALEGKIQFPKDLLTLKEVRDGNSIINFWVERAVPGDSPVSFSGIVPGGYQFPRGVILSLVFEAKASGEGAITLDGARVLRNDGNGTAVSLSLAPTVFRIAPDVEPSVPTVSPIDDRTPPEPFTPILAQDPTIFDGAWFLSFATQDKDSGIDHYEIRETTWWRGGGWTEGASPYLLKRQDPSRPIFVKAIDRAGNERVARVRSVGIEPFPYEIFAVFGILLVIAMLIAFVIGRRRASVRRRALR